MRWLELDLTSIFWMKDISITARLFKTFRTPVATSSKLDGSTYELCNIRFTKLLRARVVEALAQVRYKNINRPHETAC